MLARAGFHKTPRRVPTPFRQCADYSPDNIRGNMKRTQDMALRYVPHYFVFPAYVLIASEIVRANSPVVNHVAKGDGRGNQPVPSNLKNPMVEAPVLASKGQASDTKH